MEEYEKIFNKYVKQVSDGRFVDTVVDREKIEDDLFREGIDKKSIEYLVLLALFYGVTNINAIRDFMQWGLHQKT